MEKKHFYNSQRLLFFVSAVIAGIMFVFNSMTPYAADDFVYRLSFYEDALISDVGFLGVVKSMYAHAFAMNGRIVSHGFEQFFMLFPKTVFNITNTLIYVSLVYAVYRIVNYKNKRNCILYCGTAMAIWHYMPVFGQVCLWQVGSVNYLWSVFFGVLFLAPFVYRFTHGGDIFKHVWQKALFVVFSFVMGLYSEITSFTVIFTAVILIVLIFAMKGDKKVGWMTAAVIIAAIGYIILLRMPAEVKAKQSETDINTLIMNFREVTSLLKTYTLPIMIVFSVLFSLGCVAKIDRDRLILSVLFAFSAVMASYMMTVAKYVPERCLITTTIFAIIAVGILIPGFSGTKYTPVMICCGAILAVMFAFSFADGGTDIWDSYLQYEERVAHIEQMKNEGVYDITLHVIQPKTEYSAFYGIVDLQTEVNDTWPNTQMANYYGVETISGTE